ncbi:endoribonuclease ZC3H12A isoform X2 [Contarinia nasturtii]|uniref:endoribonuclease ZC3H12A isoform X2 n=1 Tax=Contarinia nasturtii TaxID=265458 RepID=UPI0012D3727F|nr:endoribonuclease ZC3H12A isoform X2 [Contarinia nasturtii]
MSNTYMDSLAVTEGEDSSYDSECDVDSNHEQVSRTTSDTLGQEFAEYVSQPQQTVTKKIDPSPSYTQRVEFALKLGYTEKLVQAALARLVDPAQNELLAELIKLGAQQGNKSDLCDSQNAPLNGTEAAGNSCNAINSSNGKNEIITTQTGLRPIVIDGSNVAYCHGNKEVFSCLGIRLCVDWFLNRGHKEITVFVPKFRKENPRPDNPIKDQELLFELEKERMLVYTPSRFVGGKRTVCYDDRYILKLAAESDGVVVSNDNYRDLANENLEYKKVVDERLLMYSFVADRFMPPDDPLGRSGPTLNNFLRMQPKKSDPQPQCPYGKKCTYGNKCKFYHPERGFGPHKSVTERLSEHAARHLSARNSDGSSKTVCGKSLSVPLSTNTSEMNDRRKPLARTRSCVHDGCNLSNCQESTHKQRIPNPNKTSFGNTLGADNEHIDIVTAFSESCKLENLAPELHSNQVQHQSIGNSHHSLYGVGPSTTIHTSQSPQSQSIRPILHYSTHGNVLSSSTSTGSNQSTMHDKRNDGNMHQKLQRQLSLNPNAYDPRLLRMHNAIQAKHSHPESHMQQEPTQLMQHTGHRQLAPSRSGPRTHITNHWDLHQNVTRIASAPDSSRTSNPWQNNGQTQIPPGDILSWSQNSMTVPSPAQTTQPPPNATQANRLHIQYHLSSIFPEEQVCCVMNMYPTETNPQNICAAILAMFPRN